MYDYSDMRKEIVRQTDIMDAAIKEWSSKHQLIGGIGRWEHAFLINPPTTSDGDEFTLDHNKPVTFKYTLWAPRQLSIFDASEVYYLEIEDGIITKDLYVNFREGLHDFLKAVGIDQ